MIKDDIINQHKDVENILIEKLLLQINYH